MRGSTATSPVRHLTQPTHSHHSPRHPCPLTLILTTTIHSVSMRHMLSNVCVTCISNRCLRHRSSCPKMTTGDSRVQMRTKGTRPVARGRDTQCFTSRALTFGCIWYTSTRQWCSARQGSSGSGRYCSSAPPSPTTPSSAIITLLRDCPALRPRATWCCRT